MCVHTCNVYIASSHYYYHSYYSYYHYYYDYDYNYYYYHYHHHIASSPHQMDNPRPADRLGGGKGSGIV